MPSPQNPNPLGCLSFVIYPVAILIGCFILTAIGNILGAIWDNVAKY